MKPAERSGVEILLEKHLPNVPRETKSRLLRYVDLIIRWNRSINLTGTRGPISFVEKHVLDCAFAFEIMPVEMNFMDLGSGGGLPGLVWALLAPAQEFTLVEKQKKRCAFLNQAVAELEISNARVVMGTFEEVCEGPGAPGSLVSRGTWPPAELLPLAQAASYPWVHWWVFSSKNLHEEYLKLIPFYKISAEILPYVRFDEEKGYLTRLDREK